LSVDAVGVWRRSSGSSLRSSNPVHRSDVARRHEVSRGLLWNWRRQVRLGELAPEPTPMFMPLQITADLPLALPSPSPTKAASAGDGSRIEIMLPDGTCVRVGSDVALATLRRVMAAVRR
jgi:transposase